MNTFFLAGFPLLLLSTSALATTALPAPITAPSTMLSGEGWIKVGDKYLGVNASGELTPTNQKQAEAPFIFEPNSTATAFALKSKDRKSYLVVTNLQGLEVKGLTAGSAGDAKLKFLNDLVLDASRPMFFSAEGPANGFKLKSLLSPNPYLLASTSDNTVRAFSPDAAKGGRYAAPVSKDLGSTFVFELNDPSIYAPSTVEKAYWIKHNGKYLVLAGSIDEPMWSTAEASAQATRFNIKALANGWSAAGDAIISFSAVNPTGLAAGSYPLIALSEDEAKSWGVRPELSLLRMGRLDATSTPFQLAPVASVASSPTVKFYTLKTSGMSVFVQQAGGNITFNVNTTNPTGYELAQLMLEAIPAATSIQPSAIALPAPAPSIIPVASPNSSPAAILPVSTPPTASPTVAVKPAQIKTISNPKLFKSGW